MIDYWEAQELVGLILDISEEESDDEDRVECLLLDRYGITLEDFTLLLGDLLPFVMEWKSPLTGNHYRGFGKDGCFIVKQEA